MSNVPAYPKNPAFHPESPPPKVPEDAGTGPAKVSSDSQSVEIADLDLSPPAFSFRTLVDLAPIPIVMIAAGLGFLAGRLIRR